MDQLPAAQHQALLDVALGLADALGDGERRPALGIELVQRRKAIFPLAAAYHNRVVPQFEIGPEHTLTPSEPGERAIWER